MKKHIVITSIFEPTEAVHKFSNLSDYQLIVVGDKKSPTLWQAGSAQFLSVSDQEKLTYHLAESLPFNHYSRKMLGYLEAIRQGAQLIVDTDDDNIPYDDWSFPSFDGDFLQFSEPGFVNVYHYFSTQHIWPRGLPLRLINKRFQFEKAAVANSKVGIWQGLADEDPDVDAIYRLTSDVPCFFDKKPPIVLKKGAICPFNTQNTAIVKELFPLLYLPTYVTFRYTDILRGLVAQPLMWHYGYELGFTTATVIQKRNPHDYMKDFVSEIPMYETGEQVIQWVSESIDPAASLHQNLKNAYVRLEREGVVEAKELTSLENWLYDLSALGH